MLDIAVIGAGKWGQNHVRAFKELQKEGAINRLIVCDSDEQRARSYGVDWVTDYGAVLEDANIHAVSIASPSQTHYPLGKESLEAGKDVLIEKPMTMNDNEAAELVSLATKHGRILMAGHIMRFHPAVQKLKQLIEAGWLGEVHTLIGTRLDFGLPRTDIGVIYALGIHELDTFCYLLGEEYPRAISAASSKVYSPDIEETAMLAADFGYAKGYALESWLVPVYGKKRDLVVVGSKCAAYANYLGAPSLTLFDNRIITQDDVPAYAEIKGSREVPIENIEPLKAELHHFISCVNLRATPISDGEVGLRAVVMVKAALKAAELGNTREEWDYGDKG